MPSSSRTLVCTTQIATTLCSSTANADDDDDGIDDGIDGIDAEPTTHARAQWQALHLPAGMLPWSCQMHSR